MFEKILQKLKQQRNEGSAVSDRTLEDMARSYEALITSDEALEKFDFTKFIESVEGNIQHTAKQAVVDAEKKKKSEDEKKKAEELAKKKSQQQKQTSTEPPTETPAWAQAIIDQNTKLSERLDGMQKEKETTSRKGRLTEMLKGLPEYYTKPIVAGFDKTKFDDDDDFNNYLNGIKSSKESFEQQSKEQGLNFQTPKTVEKPKPTGETPEMAKAREVIRKQKEKQQKD